jgi:hypothetical protein
LAPSVEFSFFNFCLPNGNVTHVVYSQEWYALPIDITIPKSVSIYHLMLSLFTVIGGRVPDNNYKFYMLSQRKVKVHLINKFVMAIQNRDAHLNILFLKKICLKRYFTTFMLFIITFGTST